MLNNGEARAVRIMVKALRLALKEFDRISYQIKADSFVLLLIKSALLIGEKHYREEVGEEANARSGAD